jgi:hypothetical protein
VIDCREATEEPIESSRIRCVEGRGTQGINLTGSVLEALGIPGREDYLGPFCTCTTCRFESDARATADHNNGLAKERRFMVDGRGDSYGAHGSPPILQLYFSLRCVQSESYARPKGEFNVVSKMFEEGSAFSSLKPLEDFANTGGCNGHLDLPFLL